MHYHTYLSDRYFLQWSLPILQVTQQSYRQKKDNCIIIFFYLNYIKNNIDLNNEMIFSILTSLFKNNAGINTSTYIFTKKRIGINTTNNYFWFTRTKSNCQLDIANWSDIFNWSVVMQDCQNCEVIQKGSLDILY